MHRKENLKRGRKMDQSHGTSRSILDKEDEDEEGKGEGGGFVETEK